MILAVNLNASLDKRYELEALRCGEVIRARAVENTPGGKGLHVANVATILGEDCLATGFLGGKTGELIADRLAAYGVRHDFQPIAGETRACLALISDDGAQTEVLEPGPEVEPAEQKAFLKKYEALAQKAEVIVGAGSLPRRIAPAFYRTLIGIAQRCGKKFFLDTSGEPLALGIAAKPYFIKPNRDEIEALTGRKIESAADAAREALCFAAEGVPLTAISLGAAGSVAAFGGRVYRVRAPEIRAVNPVGSGDAFVAGMAVATRRGYGIEEALRFACACGTANALEKESGFVTRRVVEELLPQVTVETL